MEIKWLGHAAFLITAEDGTKIITDPYSQGFGGINYDPIQETVDVVFASHEHGDHYGAEIKGNPQEITKPGTGAAKGIEFKGIATAHDESGGKERGPNTIFCFTIDDIRVCHLGDLGHVLSEQQVAEIGGVDISLVPVGGYFTIGAKQATEVCNQLKPKVIIPIHFKTDKCTLPIAGVEDFLQSKSNVERLDASKQEFKKAELPDLTKIVVLQHAL